MKNAYSVQLIWSNEDGCYLAQVPELPGCASDGQTTQEALANLSVIVDEWIETARALGRPIPEPMTLERLEQEGIKAQQQLLAGVRSGVEAAINHAVAEALSAQNTSAGPLPIPGLRFNPGEFAAGAKRR